MTTTSRAVIEDHEMIADDLTKDEILTALECVNKVYNQMVKHHAAGIRNYERNLEVLESLIRFYQDRLDMCAMSVLAS
ncbi:hypothetical protein [Marinoscillum sp. MHG1-6]|uniref:hypothetical protein n=1 Tax=Marinoscillum sp. MHG1-6 TaxID=2959627 RepID=UPI00215804A3|nr:hypothetical protein [Marinoscillum sp. MHG1-6]